MRLETQFDRLDLWEAELCIRCNAVARTPRIRSFFALVSRLGDGIAWYVMLLLLPVVYGAAALGATAQMGLTALAGVVVYRLLKDRLTRERPYASDWRIKALAPPLDRYSFPSGHTLHASAFTVMVGHYFPDLLPVVVPFALCVAASRVALGLHYPSDVLAGGVLGGGLAWLSIAAFPTIGL